MASSAGVNGLLLEHRAAGVAEIGPLPPQRQVSGEAFFLLLLVCQRHGPFYEQATEIPEIMPSGLNLLGSCRVQTHLGFTLGE